MPLVAACTLVVADLRAHTHRVAGSTARCVGSPPENCTDIWRFGLIVMALSSSVLMSSQRQLVDEADLVGVHEARVAHHVAAVGQIDREHRAAAVRDGAAAVVVQLRVVVRADVAAGEDIFEVLEERRVDRHHVFEVAVDRAILHHQDLAVALDHLRLDLAGLVGVEDFERRLAVQNLLADFRHAARAQRIGLARPAEVAAWSFPSSSEAACRYHFRTNPGSGRSD